MAEQQGVSLSLCPHEAQSLGMMIRAYKSTWSGHMPCCLPFSPLPSSSVANGGSPRGGSCLPADGKDKVQGSGRDLSHGGCWGSRLPECMKLTVSLKVNAVCLPAAGSSLNT